MKSLNPIATVMTSWLSSNSIAKLGWWGGSKTKLLLGSDIWVSTPIKKIWHISPD